MGHIMRIGFDAKRAFHNFRGLGNYSRNLIDGLDQSFDDLNLFLYSPVSRNKNFVNWGNSLTQAKLVWPKSFLSQHCSSFWRSLFLSNVVKSDKLDIFHGLSHELPPSIGQNAKGCLVTIHDLIFMRFPHFFPKVDRLVYKAKYKSACDRADIILAICENTKKDIIEFLGVDEKKVRIAYQSCHPSFEKLIPKNDLKTFLKKLKIPKKYFLQIGSIEENKNLLLTIKSFSKIQKDFPDTYLVVVSGGGNKLYKEKVLKTISDNKLEEKVIFKNSLPSDSLPYLYQGALSLIFPSFYEGFGIPIIESMFSGTPVITSKDGCFKEAGGPHSLYVDPSSIEDLSKAMSLLLSDELLRSKISRDSLEFVKKFHFRNTSKILRSIYQELL
ncbi:MAG: mannosyltransferase [Halobacteriovoraceae bacterium]|nr:mannosyltransferase [Halobacteriovoraceae bacterium]|tara:strand:- start:868 stop:2022 length:1155 start_codon:yes stop_codon:yes gene_type:complete